MVWWRHSTQRGWDTRAVGCCVCFYVWLSFVDTVVAGRFGSVKVSVARARSSGCVIYTTVGTIFVHGARDLCFSRVGLSGMIDRMRTV